MGFGLGFVLEGVRQGQEDKRRKEREDFAFEEAKKDSGRRDFSHEQAVKQAGRADTEWQQKQDDRAFGLPHARKAIERQSEHGDLLLEMQRNEAEIARLLHGANTEAAQMEAIHKVKQLEIANEGLVYKTYKMKGGKAAAQMLNALKSNGINNAADVIEEKDAKTGKIMLKVVDASGNVVNDPKRGQAIFDKAAIEAAFNPGEKGRFSQEDGIVLDTMTGDTRGIPGYTGKGQRDAEKHNMDKLKLAIDKVLQPHYGGTLDAMGNWSLPEGNRDIALNAKALAEYKIGKGMDPVRAAEESKAEADSGVLPPHRWKKVKLDDGSVGIDDGKGVRRPTDDESKRYGLPGKGADSAPAKLKDTYVKKTPAGEVKISRKQIEETAKKHGKTPEQVIKDLGLQ